MKVAVFLVDDLGPAAGGNFSYYDKFVRAIDGYSFSSPLEICFVGRGEKPTGLVRSYVKLSSPGFYRLFRLLRRTGLSGIFRRQFSLNPDRSNHADVATLKKHNVDIVLVPKQFSEAIEDFPFMTVNWDSAHKSSYAFPEFVENYPSRDRWFSVYIQRGLSIIVESEASKEEFHRYYAIDKSKLDVVPLFPGGVVDMHVDEATQRVSLEKFSLTKDAYFFYPAQFWAHKNHYNLILAFREFLKNTGRTDIRLVFTGSDKGNKDYIRSVINENNLEKNVIMLGFVSNEEMFTLYKNALALTMPTFLGPTNMPVLEAMELGTAVACSDLAGHRESCSDGALYVAPEDQAGWTRVMTDLLNNDFRSNLLARAKVVAAVSPFTIQSATQRLEDVLLKYVPIRKTFG